jgi:sugar transferase (PEP-CTERM system associated)
MQLFNRHVSARGLTVFAFETALISGSMLMAAQLQGSFDAAVSNLWRIGVITGVCALCFYYNDLYNLTAVHSIHELVARIFQGTGAAAIALAAVSVLLPSLLLGHDIVVSMCLLIVSILLWRVAYNELAHDTHLEDRVLMLGTGRAARTVAEQIRLQHEYPSRIVGFIEDGAEPGIGRGAIGTIADLPGVIAKHRVNRIVVSLSDRRGKLPLQELLQAKLAGVRVEEAATTYERLTGKLLIDEIKPSWLIFSDGFRTSWATRLAKRAVDIVLAVIVLILAAPFMAIVALAIHFDAPGPILYRQERVGENGRVFTLYKFRSMRVDAEHGTPVWARDHDDRVTRVGRFIRLVRLDELPQLWNVLRGDMSFVGPRPERPYFVEQLAAAIPYYMERHAVKPGITGWAQVKYRYGASFEDAVEKLRYDLYYIKHLSIVFDLTIVMDTVKVILLGKGAQ